MKRIRDIVISTEEPNDNSVAWLFPLDNGTYKCKIYSFGGWTDISLGTKGDKGDTGEQGEPGPAGTDGKSITAIALTTNSEGAVTGGTATLSDKSTIQITVTQE